MNRTIAARTDPQTVAEMTLPGRWSFTPQSRNTLLKAGGVRDIREL